MQGYSRIISVKAKARRYIMTKGYHAAISWKGQKYGSAIIVMVFADDARIPSSEGTTT